MYIIVNAFNFSNVFNVFIVRSVFHLQEKIAEKKAKITALIRDNTNRLDQLCILLNEKKSFEGELDSRQKSSVSVIICGGFFC